MRNLWVSLLVIFLLWAVNGAGKESMEGKKPAPGKVSQEKIVARIDGKEIRLSDLDYDLQKRYEFELHKLEENLYQEQRFKLTKVIERILLEKEAKSRNTTPDELIAMINAEPEGEEKAEKVDKEKLYQNSLDNMKGIYPGFTEMSEDKQLEELKRVMGFKGSNKEEVKNEIAEMNKKLKPFGKKNEFIKELREKANIEILLERPELIKLDVSPDDDPYLGGKDAKITLIEFADYQCPFCSKVRPVLNDLLAKKGDKIKVVFRDLPLPSHQNAKVAAEAAECADEQGKFWGFHDLLFDNQGSLDSESLKGYAKSAGLNLEEFTQCLESGRQRKEVDQDAADARLAGIRSTPSILVNGYYITGNPSVAYLEEVIADVEKGQIPRVQEDAGKG